MKKYLLLLGLLISSISLLAQNKGIQYQAVIQDPTPYQIPGTFIQGQALQNAKVSIRFTLKSNNFIEYAEEHETQTDNFGLINLTIGKGKKLNSPNFDNLIWSVQNKVLVVSVKIPGQSDYTEVSNQTLLYSPYALYADAVEYKNVLHAPTDVSSFTNDVGYLVSNDLKPLEKKINDNQTQNIANFNLLKDQQISLEKKVDEHGKMIQETVEITKQLSTKVDQQGTQIIQNKVDLTGQINQTQIYLSDQINGLAAAYEVLANKSAATDLGNTNASNQLYPTQRAVKTYVDQAISNVVVSGAPNATTLAPGKVQLAGDLSGTATNPTVPGLATKESLINKSLNVSSDGASDTKYPSVRAVKTYVDQATQGIALAADLNAKADKNSPTFTGTPSLPTGTIGVKQGQGTNTNQLATTSFVQQELSAASTNINAKEDVANKSTSTMLGTSNTLYPTQNAVKTYVDNQISSATVADASLSSKGIIQLGGDLAASSSTASNPIIRDNAISTSKIQNSAVTDAKIASGINGNKISGDIAGNAANVTGVVEPLHGGTGVAGTLTGYVKASANSPMAALQTIPVGDISGAESTANKSNDVSADAASTTKYPNVSAIKSYVDNQMAQGNIPEATTTVLGKIKLGGDLAGTGTNASNPIIRNDAITTSKILDLAVTTDKILSIRGNKVDGDIGGNAGNVTGIVDASHGGTGTNATLRGYVIGNGPDAMSSLSKIPVADVLGAELITNKSTAQDLGNSNPSDELYPSQKAVKRYVDNLAGYSIGSATQAALDAKEDKVNKSDGDIANNSSTLYPTQRAVKTYVEGKLGSQIIGYNNLPNLNPDKLLGNLTANVARPSEVSTSGSGDVVRTTGASMTLPVINGITINGSIGGNAVLQPVNGGLGTSGLSSGYVKAGTPFSTVSRIPVSDVNGAVQKVNGSTPDAQGNVTVPIGTTYTGPYNNGVFTPIVPTPTNSDIYIVSNDPTAINNGRAFIFDGTTWFEFTTNQASLDSRFVKLTGSTMAGNLSFPTGTKIQITDQPTSSTDVANKEYVDQKSLASFPDATSVVMGKIRLGGDLAGPSTSATSPIISNGAINSAKIASGAVTPDKIAGIITPEKGGTGIDNGNKTITLGGNLTTLGTYTTALTSTGNTSITLPTSGTLSTLAGNESLTNKTINGIQFETNATGFILRGGDVSKRLSVTNDATLSGTNTGDQTINFSGDVTGSGTGNITVALSSSGVTSGVYGGNGLIPQISVDSKGRIISASNLSLSNTSLQGTSLSNGKFLIGNNMNAATEQIISGDISISNLGEARIGSAKVTNSMLAGNIDLSSKVSNQLSILNGGTGVSSLPAKSLLVGGNSLEFIAPGTAGNILRSDGTSWLSSSVSSLNLINSIGSVNSSATEKGMTLSGSLLQLSPANEFYPGVVNISAQTFAGNKSFLNDVTVNQVNIGNGPGNNSSNTKLGSSNFTNNTTGINNTAVGKFALQNNTSGSNNTGIGLSALVNNTTGDNNTAIGSGAGVQVNTGGITNTIAIGAGAIVSENNTIQLGNSNSAKLNTSAQIYAGGIQNTPIGSIVKSTGAFLGLSTTGTSSGQVVLTDNNNLLSSTATLSVANGGTGQNYLNPGALLKGNGTNNVDVINVGSDGQILVSRNGNWVAENNNPAITVGLIGSANSKGMSLVGGTLSLSPADATNPGIVTTGAQSFAGAKTFSSIISSGDASIGGNLSITGSLNNSVLTASKVVFTDASKNLSSTGTVGVNQGGTGLASIPANGVVVGNGTGNITTVVPNTIGQVLTWNGTAWAATVPTALSAGTLGTSTVNGLSVSNNVISLSPADATNPGIVTTGTQTFGGIKTFSGIKLSTTPGTLEVSKGLFTDALGNLTTSGTLGVSQGGTGNSTFPSGSLLLGNGTNGITTLAPGNNNGYILKVLGGQWAVGAAPNGGNQEASDQMFVSTDGQTLFTLSSLPQGSSVASTSTLKMYVNGVRIDISSYSVSNRTVTYDPSKNGSYILKRDDRILFDYAY